LKEASGKWSKKTAGDSHQPEGDQRERERERIEVDIEIYI